MQNRLLGEPSGARASSTFCSSASAPHAHKRTRPEHERNVHLHSLALRYYKRA
ncbi:unnamed protein product, partial [Nesidiocoris tenuis]